MSEYNLEFKEIKNLNENTLKLLSILKYDWIAKDKDGYIYNYKHKPCRCKTYWISDSSDLSAAIIHAEDYKNVNFDWLSWEDEEPVHIPTLLKECGHNER